MGITAASRIKKSVLCLVTNSVSVDQWKHQFQLWTNLQDHQISRQDSSAQPTMTFHNIQARHETPSRVVCREPYPLQLHSHMLL